MTEKCSEGKNNNDGYKLLHNILREFEQVLQEKKYERREKVQTIGQDSQHIN